MTPHLCTIRPMKFADFFTGKISKIRQVHIYNSTLKLLLDVFAPLKDLKITDRPNPAWYTSDIHKKKKEVRRLERVWRTHSLDDQIAYTCAQETLRH